jgi:hypothetical protein
MNPSYVSQCLLQPAYVTLLSAELVNEHSQAHVRNAAGLALKNAFTSRVRITQVREDILVTQI